MTVVTVLSILLAGLPRTVTIDLPADTSLSDSFWSNSSGRVEKVFMHGYWFYFRYEPGLSYSDEYDRAWIQFDVSAIPDSAEIESVALRFYQYQFSKVPSTWICRTWVSLENDPEALFMWLTYGQRVSGPLQHAFVGWVNHQFSPAGIRAFDSCVTYNRAMFGIIYAVDSGYGSAYGRGEMYPPYLRVTYHLSGLAETGDEGEWPAVGPAVVHNTLYLSGPQSATLLDPLGRAVRSFRPGANDVATLSPGIYFVVGQRAATKVVLQR